MTLSDIISILALAISIITGIGNYLYSKRTFEAATYPSLKAWLDGSSYSMSMTLLRVGLANLSSNVVVTDIVVRIQVASPLRTWRFWRKQWSLFKEDKVPDMKPLERDVDTLNYGLGHDLNEFVFKHFRYLFQPNGEINDEEFKSNYRYYKFVGSKPLNLLLTVEYKPGISVAAKRKFSALYSLIPKVKAVDDILEPGGLHYFDVKEIH